MVRWRPWPRDGCLDECRKEGTKEIHADKCRHKVYSRYAGLRQKAVKEMLKSAARGDEEGIDRMLAWALERMPADDQEMPELLDGAVRATRALKAHAKG